MPLLYLLLLQRYHTPTALLCHPGTTKHLTVNLTLTLTVTPKHLTLILILALNLAAILALNLTPGGVRESIKRALETVTLLGCIPYIDHQSELIIRREAPQP